MMMNGVSRFFVRAGMVGAIMGGIYVFLLFPLWFPWSDRTQRSINILVWPNVIETKHCIEFEKKTGIKVYLTYFENYESLLVKMKASGGGDYDLVMIADYFIHDMAKQGIIKPINAAKITAWDLIYPQLLNLPFDPGNRYSVPFSWEAYGLGIDMDYFKDKPIDATWGILFDKNKAPEHVGMLDAVREVVSIASLYLFGFQKELTQEQLAEVKDLLVKQKEWVAMYSDLRSDYMLVSKLAPVVLAISSEIYQAMRYNKNIKFILPREGSFMMVDSFVIPAKSEKEDLVCQFLNYLYDPAIIREYVTRYNFFPAVKNAHAHDHLFLTPVKSLLSRLHFFTRQVADQQLRKLWITVKS